MHFEISRAYTPGKPLTPAQRTSSLFAEEPVVMGTVLRRGLPALKISEAQFHQHQAHLKRLFDAGAINIKAVDGDKVVDLRDAQATKKVAELVPAASDELQSLQAGDDKKTEDAPAGDAPPAGAGAEAPVETAPVLTDAETAAQIPAFEPAPEVVQPEEAAGKVEEHHEASSKRRRGKKE
jgi:hypothetical protein